MLIRVSIILLAVAIAPTIQEQLKCTRDFRKIGCFTRDLKLLPDLLITDLDPTHTNFTTDINWGDYTGSLHSLACRCREKALGHYKYFGIGMYGECLAGKDNAALETLFKNPTKSPYSCVNGEHEDCDVDKPKECVGTVDADFFYEVLTGDCSLKIASGNVLKLIQNQVKIEKNKRQAVIPKLGMIYEITLEVYPTGFQVNWASVLHMTIAGDHGIYGERVPGIWFWPSSASATTNRLHICNSLDTTANHCYNSKNFPVNQWIKIKINQVRVGKDYIYKVYLNGEQVKRHTNTRPTYFKDVKVYTGDPWYNPQAGYIRNLKIAENCNDQPSIENGNKLARPTEAVLKRNTLVGTLTTLCKEYSVSFEVKPTAFAATWRSVLHVTIGGDSTLYGDRIPGVWFHPSSTSAVTNALHICTPISRVTNNCFNSEQLPKNQWISVKLKQTLIAAEYFYSIVINGREVRKIKNTRPMDFYDLKVYAGNPWYAAQAGSIRNINIDGECPSASKAPIGEIVNLLPNKTLIERNKQISVINHIGKIYEINVEVYPTSYQAGWGSILHLSAAGDIGVYGERVPGIWFKPSSASAKTNSLYICNTISGNTDYCYTSKEWSLNQWIKIKVNQVQKGSKYIYGIYINDEQVFRLHNTRPAEFGNVKVYAGDPWYAAQAGFIRNLVIPKNFNEQPSIKNGNKLSLPTESVLKRNALVGTISRICKEYSVSFEVKPTAFAAGWHTVFHVTVGEDGSIYGDRTPGVWFHPSSASAATNALHICTPISGIRNNCYNSEQLPKNQWISVKLKQTLNGAEYFYSIELNGKEVRKIKNTRPMDFYDLKVYAGNPWYAAQAGSIRNINIDGGKCSNN